jgi:hypothetical protein
MLYVSNNAGNIFKVFSDVWNIVHVFNNMGIISNVSNSVGFIFNFFDIVGNVFVGTYTIFTSVEIKFIVSNIRRIIYDVSNSTRNV